MKKLGLKILIFIILLFSADRLIGWYLDKLYEQNFYHYSNGHLNYYLKKQHADTLIVGSSRAINNINPLIFGKKTFALGEPKKHLGWFAAVIDLLEQFKKLPKKTLILHLDPEDFNSLHEDQLNSDIHYLKYYYNKNEFIYNEINNASPFEWIKYLSSCFRHNGDNLVLLTNPLQGVGFLPEQNGFIPIKSSDKDSIRVMTEIAKMDKNESASFSSSKAIFYFDHIHDICLKNNIELIIITSPLFKADANFIQSAQLMAEFLKRKNIPYINFLRNCPNALKNIKLWFDNLHFNEQGANLYSKELKILINNLRPQE
jgi:hypothetical protein